jgi:hypothetical protein
MEPNGYDPRLAALNGLSRLDLIGQLCALRPLADPGLMTTDQIKAVILADTEPRGAG